MAFQLKFMVPLILLVSLSLVAPLIQAKDVNYCDKKADYDVKVSAVDITPYPVARGKPASFSISATTGTSISGGNLVIEVSYFGWHIHSETHDLCAETSCPVSIGDFVIAHSQDLPGFTPPGLPIPKGIRPSEEEINYGRGIEMHFMNIAKACMRGLYLAPPRVRTLLK